MKKIMDAVWNVMFGAAITMILLVGTLIGITFMNDGGDDIIGGSFNRFMHVIEYVDYKGDETDTVWFKYDIMSDELTKYVETPFGITFYGETGTDWTEVLD